MQVTLRKSDLDPIGVKVVPYFRQHCVFEIGDSILGIVDPDAQNEIDGAVTEFIYKAFRTGVL